MTLLHAARLAGKQLFHNKVRLVVAIAGIAFAVLLVFMQTGFRIAIFRSVILYWEQLDADLIVTDRLYAYVGNPGVFSRRHLYRCLTIPGVEFVNPLYVTRAKWKNPDNGILSSIAIFGVDPANPGFSLPEIWANRTLLHRADALLFDTFSQPRYGPIVERFRRDGRVPVILCDREAEVAGLYTLGKPFDVDGTAMVSAEGFMRLFPNHPQGLITLGLLRVRAGEAITAVQNALRGLLKDDLMVHTKEEFIQVEYNYIDKHNPIGFVFNLGTIMGLIVGIVIVYQVLFTDVSEHFAEYATLKAMGYANAFLFAVVGIESMVLAVTGFLPGLLVSWALYQFTAAATSLPMFMTLPHMLQVLLFTMGMCGISGAVALYKVAQADPADVF
jgi:putative ABC transport system permease protein